MELGKTKSSQTRTLCRGLSAPAAKTAKEETPRELNAVILKIFGKSKIMKTLKDLTSYHKGYIPYQGILTLHQIASQKQSRKGMFFHRTRFFSYEILKAKQGQLGGKISKDYCFGTIYSMS